MEKNYENKKKVKENNWVRKRNSEEMKKKAAQWGTMRMRVWQKSKIDYFNKKEVKKKLKESKK